MQPQRKHPRLTGHNYSSGGSYFVTICTKNKEKLLGTINPDNSANTISEPVMRLSDYGKIAEEALLYLSENVMCPALEKFVIMPNHIHMIISIELFGADGNPRPTQALVPKYVASLKRFTSRKSKAKLWQTSYYDHIIRSDDDYIRICKYIEDNPYKWANDDYYVS